MSAFVNVVRSVGAVVAGIAAYFAASVFAIGAFGAPDMGHEYPSLSRTEAFLRYAAIVGSCALAGGAVAAALAPSRPLRHALAFGAIFTAIFVIAPRHGVFPLAGALLALPSAAIAGGVVQSVRRPE